MPEVEGDRERLDRLAYEAQVLQGQGQSVREQLGALAVAVAQLQAAIESLKLLKEKGKATGFVPVGAGVLAPASIGDGRVLVEVGANVLVERPCEDALADLEARLKETMEAQERTQQGAIRLGQRLRVLDLEARGIVERMRASSIEE